MSARGQQAVRGAAAAGVALLVAALSHVAAGGGAPGGAGLAVAAAFSLVVCVALAGKRMRLPTLAISVLISQFAFHLLFGVGAPGVFGPASGAGGHHGMATTAPDAAASLSALAAAGQHGVHGASGMDAGMWAGHAVAALVTIALLHRGGVALRSLAALALLQLGALVRLPFIVPLPERSPSRADGLAVVERLRDLGLLLGGLRHRGPPAAFAALR